MALAQWGSHQPLRVVIVRELFIMIELPLLFIAVAHAYDYTLRKRLPPMQSLAVSAATSTSKRRHETRMVDESGPGKSKPIKALDG